MSNVSTFGTYALARLGIYAAQSAINITGNNIANVSTNGYSRQFIDQVSLNMGGADRYQSKMDTRIGSGAYVLGVTQLRDPYLDIRYRNEQSSLGSYEGWLQGLNQIASVLDEVGRGEDEAGILEARFNELIQQMQNLVTQGAGRDDMDTLVRSACTSIVNTFHSYASQLQTEFDNMDTYFRQDLDEVNSILERIRDLDASIRKTEIYGGNALELKDSRNVLIDELSKYLSINVTYEKDKVGEGVYVDRLVITTAGDPQRTLVNGVYCTQLSIRQVQAKDDEGNPMLDDDSGEPVMVDSPNYDIDLGLLTDSNGRILETTTDVGAIEVGGKNIFNSIDGDLYNVDDALALINAANSGYPKEGVDPDGSMYTCEYVKRKTGDDTYEIHMIKVYNGEAQLTDNELYGKLQSEREVLTEVGEYTDDDTLDNVDSSAATKRGIPYYQKALDTLANAFAYVLNKANNAAGGLPLISNDGIGNSTANINASNISISYAWSIKEAYIIESKQDDAGSTANDNLQYILGLLTGDIEFTTALYPGDDIQDDYSTEVGKNGGKLTFTGSFQEFLTTHMAGTLANDISTAQTMLDNHEITSENLYVERDSVMGVDLNDEAMNLMQYQKAYQAACRLMTVYDEMLNKLINGT